MNIGIFNRYVIKNLGTATIFVAVTLAAIILMVQSLKFLDLIISAGASSRAFWHLTFLALPSFFEIILPIALMVAALFVYNRMSTDSEITVMRAAGHSPLQMAKPAIIMGVMVSVILVFITFWLAPKSLSNMHQLRQVIKAQYSLLLFQEGLFNQIGKDLTVYINKKTPQGELEGLLIHDSRPENPAPVTIIAKRGVIVSSDTGQQVLVYEGSRQDFNKRTGVLNRLDFQRYSIDFPDNKTIFDRWKEPDERTFYELLNPNKEDINDMQKQSEFAVEVHGRISGAFLPLSYILVAVSFLLLGQVNKRGQSLKVLLAVVFIIILQSLYLSGAGIANHNFLGIVIMYAVSIFPIIISLFFLSSYGENILSRLLFRPQNKVALGYK